MADPIQETEKLYSVRLPQEYKSFLQNKTYQKFSGHYSSLVGGGRETQAIRFFVGASIYDVDWDSGDDFSFENLDGLQDEDPDLAENVIPFAAFDASGDGEIDSGALALDVTKEKSGKCPVYQYDDDGLSKIAGSIAEFLSSLSAEPPDGDEDDD